MVRALIFDFDGLILDTETPDFETWAALYQQHGFALEHARWIQGVGTYGGFDPLAELLALAGGSLDSATLQKEFQQRYRERCMNSALLPGVAALLQAARETKLPCAVASSSDRAWVEGWLAHHAIRDFFRCVRTRNDVERVKPAPDLFLSAAACLGVSPNACVVFEDSPNGMRAAAAAGMRCVAVPIAINGKIELPPVALRLRALDELPLDKLLARLAE